MKIRRNIVANFIGQGWSALMAAAFIPALINAMGIEAYGLIGLFALFQLWLGILDMGMAPTLSREAARLSAGQYDVDAFRDLLRTFEWFAFYIGCGIFLILALSSNWISTGWLNLSSVTPTEAMTAIVLMGAVIALRFVETISRSALLGAGHQIDANLATVIVATLRNPGAIAILYLISPTIHAYFIWQLTVSLFGLALTRWMLGRRLPAGSRKSRLSMSEFSKIKRFAGGMMGINVLALLLSQIDKLLLSKFLPLAEFGYYSFSATVGVALISLVSPITLAVYPQMVAAVTNGDRASLARQFHLSAQLTAVAVVPISITLATLSNRAIFSWSGNIELTMNSSTLVSIMALGYASNGLMQLLYYLQLAHGWTSLIIKMNLISIIIFLPSIFLIFPYFGSMGVAMLWLILNISYIVILAPIVINRLLSGAFGRWALIDNAAIFLASLVGPAAIALITVNIPPSRLSDLAIVTLAGITSLMSALAASPSTWQWLRANIRIRSNRGN